MATLTLIASEADPRFPWGRFDDDRCYECGTMVGAHVHSPDGCYDVPTFTTYAPTEIPGALLCEDCAGWAEDCAP